jgi:hypothetical protein
MNANESMIPNGTNGRLVLRTCYLSTEDDSRLRALAFKEGVSKGQLIRQAVQAFLAKHPASGDQGDKAQVHGLPDYETD